MLRCEQFRTEREAMMQDMEELCKDEDEMETMNNGNEDDMMNMLIGKGMEDDERKHEKGIEIVQRYMRQSLRKRKDMIG